MAVIVPPSGKSPSSVLLIGEAPGKTEAELGRPFVGKSGDEQERYLSRHNLCARSWRISNVIPEYIEGNPDPSPALIAKWTPHLLKEIHTCNPRLIIAVGRFAARWFLGENLDLDQVHGLPYLAGAFDSSRSSRAPESCVILPIYHPAWGLRTEDDPDSLAKTILAQDYAAVADTLSLIKSNRPVPIIHDEHEGNEIYIDATGQDIADYLLSDPSSFNVLAIDTEGQPGSPWSAQISIQPGTGLTLRRSQPDFQIGTDTVQQVINRGCLIVTHQASTPSGCMYDTRLCREMGLDLSRANLFDTMYFAFLLRLESQSLKTLSSRWCGMKMEDYQQIIGDIGRDKQLSYLANILSHSFPKPQSRILQKNDGTKKNYTPNHIHKTVERILSDYYSGKVNKDGDETDPEKRWQKIDKILKHEVESILGPLPTGSLADIPLDRAIYYSSRDPDATLRLYYKFLSLCSTLDLGKLSSTGMEVLPVFEEIQSNGMPASRPHFVKLREELQSDIDKMQRQLSVLYYGGKPFNPKSNIQVASLIRRRGLSSGKRTKKGAMSTGKKSIEHLRFKDPAIELVFDWRERQHLRDMFCNDVLARIPDSVDSIAISPKIKPTRVHTRRLAMEDPNLLAVPIRTELGRKIREGYKFPDDSDEVFGSWDLSQVEMRVLAHDSQSKFLCDKFNSGADVHTETAMLVFGLHSADEVDDFLHRLPAKTTNFGLIYGEQGPGLSDQLRTLGLEGWDVQACDKLQREIIKLFGIESYTRLIINQARKDGFIRDHWGMYRYLPNLSSRNPKLAAEAGRQAIAHRISGWAQGMIQHSMVWLKYRIRELQDDGHHVLWRLQIHDELILSFYSQLWDTINPIIMEGLTKHCGIRLRVPVLAKGHMSKSWAGLK